MSNMFRALNEFLEEVRQLKKENAELKARIDRFELLETWFNRLPDEMVSKSEILEVIRELGE